MTTDFEMDAAGNIRLFPLTGYGLAPVAGMMCLLKLDYATDPKEWPPETVQSVQLGVLPAAARELGQALLRMADRLEQPDQIAVPQ